MSQQAALNDLRRWRRYEENDRRNNVTSPINRAGLLEDLIDRALGAGCSLGVIAREVGLSVHKVAGMTTRTSRSSPADQRTRATADSWSSDPESHHLDS